MEKLYAGKRLDNPGKRSEDVPRADQLRFPAMCKGKRTNLGELEVNENIGGLGELARLGYSTNLGPNYGTQG